MLWGPILDWYWARISDFRSKNLIRFQLMNFTTFLQIISELFVVFWLYSRVWIIRTFSCPQFLSKVKIFDPWKDFDSLEHRFKNHSRMSLSGAGASERRCFSLAPVNVLQLRPVLNIVLIKFYFSAFSRTQWDNALKGRIEPESLLLFFFKK